MTTAPSVALNMLNDFNDKGDIYSLSQKEFYEYNILLAEARYKCDSTITNNKTLNDIVIYFDSLTYIYPKNTDVLFQNSRAHYYRGVGFEEDDKYKEAFNDYLKSLKLIERIKFFNNNQNIDIIHFNALIYVRLSDILYWLDVYNASIECLINANQLFEIENNLSATTRNNIVIATMYAHMYNYDMALKHLTLADASLTKIDKDSPLKYVIERINSTIMYNMGYHEEPFKTMIRQYKTLDIPNLRMEAAGVLGDIYYGKGMLDSAVYYYEQYFPDNKYSKIDAANHIIEIGLKTNNNDLMTKYTPILAKETNEELLLSTIKTDISSIYENYNINRKNTKLHKKIATLFLFIILTTISLLFLGLYILSIKKRKYNNEIDKKKYYINALQEKIEKKSSENKHIKQHIKNLEKELQDIKTKRYLTHIPFDMKLKNLMETPLCQRLIEISHDNTIKTNIEYPDLQIDEETQKELIELFNRTFDNIFNKIISEHEGLKHQDNLYFCLYLLGLNEKHISAVTGKTYNTVYNRTKRIQEILGSEKSIRETLRDMA
jgi:cell division protein FtsB